MSIDGSVHRDALRFLVAGGINTALTTLVYFLGLQLTSPTLSYGLAWLVGLAFVVTLYPDQVFSGGRATTRDRLAVGAVTVLTFASGLMILHNVERALESPALAFVITIAATTVLNFTLSRWVLRRR